MTSATPVTTGDVTGATNVYYASYHHNLLPSYSATEGAVILRKFTEITISLAGLAANTNFDIYAKYTGGAWVGSTIAWAGDTTRAATTPTRLAGSQLYASSADTEAIYLGTIRTTGTIGQCEDSQGRRFVWNRCNRVTREMRARDGSTASWTYTTNTIREWNAASTEGTSRVGFVRGFDEGTVTATLVSHNANSTALVNRSIGIGLDASNAFAAACSPGMAQPNFTNGSIQVCATYADSPGLGYHTLRNLETSGATGTTTWQNFLANTYQSGMVARTAM